MRKSSLFYVVIIVLLVVVKSAASAQDNVAPDELLRWLPDQPYRVVNYTDFIALRKVAEDEGMQLGFLYGGSGDWFIEDIQAKLIAVPLQVQWRGDEALPTHGDMQNAEELIAEESPEVLKGYELGNREVRILVFEDADAVIKKAVEIGVLVPHEEQSYRGYDFYRMKRPVTDEKTGRWITTAVDGRYLFLATSIPQIQRMLDTNGQTDLSAYGGLHLSDLLERLGELGPNWQYEATGMTLDEISAVIAEANGWPPEALKRVQNRQRYKRRCQISTQLYGDEWYNINYYVFDPEIALHESDDAKKLAPVELGEPVEPREIPIPEGLEMSVRIEGNVIIYSTRRDEYERSRWKETQEQMRVWREKIHSARAGKK